MLKYILVPLDGSKLAETALPYAQHIVEDGGRITLLLILEKGDSNLMSPDTSFIKGTLTEKAILEKDDEIQRHAQDYLDHIGMNIARTNLQVEKIANFGHPAEEIVNLAKASATDAIVMSTHGRTGLTRWIMGSVTQKVISAAPCPVFVIPNKA